jgi:hypothetical protein
LPKNILKVLKNIIIVPPIDYEEIDGWEVINEEKKKSAPNSIGGKIYAKIKSAYHHIFTRDFRINGDDFLLLVLQCLISITAMVFWFNAIESGTTESGNFEDIEDVFIYTTAGVSVFFGGIFVDYFIRKKTFFERLTIAAFITQILLIIPFKSINVIAAIILSVIIAIMGIMSFTVIISKTTLLNRARIVSLVMFIIIIFAAPLTVTANNTKTYWWMSIVTLVLGILYILQRKRTPHELIIGQIKDSEILSIKNFFETIRKSKILPYLYFLFLTSVTLGFYVTFIFAEVTPNQDLLVAVIVAVITFPIVGATLDNIGRKPVVLFSMLLVGLLSIFFDLTMIYVAEQYIVDIQIIVFIFAAIVMIILTAVIAGDSSMLFTRGRIMGLFLFVTIGGFIIGDQIQKNFVPEVTDPEFYITVSDYATALLFISVILLSKAKEPYQIYTPYWRYYVKKLYLMTFNGIGLYSVNLKTFNTDHKELKEDLVSGGLSGIQSMLKEISQSDKKIQVLDHGDTKLIFHHGVHSIAVLFVKRDLVVYREKLAQFHKSFEFHNEKILEKFTGNVSKLVKMDDLTKQFFT